MAKALSDAGFRVVVVSLRAPVAELREMSRAVEYIEVGPRPFTARIVSILNFRVFARNRRLQAEAEALARGGWRALAVRVWRFLTAPFAGDARLLRRYLLAAPAAALLRKPEQEFTPAWQELSAQPAAAILASLVLV